MNAWKLNSIDHALMDFALREDLGELFVDITTMTLFESDLQNKKANIISKSKEDIVVAGIPLAFALLEKIEKHLMANHAAQIKKPFQLQINYDDGKILKPGQTLLTIEANAQTLLIAERTLLNFLRHLCAIATLTKKFVNKIKHTPCKILDTRKTTPGLRHLEKYAVHCGGGVNHRMGLYDAFMIKDTHIDLLGSMKKAIEKLPSKSNNNLPVIVEIRNIEELKKAIQYGKNKIDRVLLDNMTPDQLRECVALCKNIFETEASGNINLNTIVKIAETGVDYASIGMLTYAAGHVDLSMQGI